MHESFYDELVIDALAARCAPDGQADFGFGLATRVGLSR
jgi:hypothetical protein